MRPYLLFISGAAGMAGMISADGFALNLSAALGFAAFFLAYGFGQALTDCFQIDTDRLSAPYRPLSKGTVTPRAVGTVAFIGLTLLAGILIYLNIYNALFGLLSIIGLATYSYVKRHFWWAGPFYNAWIVALLPMMGFLAGSGENLASTFHPQVILIAALSFFSYANFVLMGYLKDIAADRKTGYRTFSVVFGWNASVWAGDLFVIISAYLSFSLSRDEPLALAASILAAIVAASGQLFAHFTSNKTERNAAYPIASTVRAFILWHLAVWLTFRPEQIWISLAFYAAFEWTLRARPMHEQI